MRRLVLVLSVATALTAGSAAQATLQVFTIEPTQSVISAAGSELTAHLGGLIGDVTVPFQSQVGHVIGVGGGVLPDGSTSDGLFTAFGGQLLVDRTPGAIQFRSQITEITPFSSGAWRPGIPVDPGRPAAAQLGGYLADAALGFNASIAIREAAFVYSSPAALALTPNGVGFDFDARQLFGLAAGVLDFDTSLFGLDDSNPLDQLGTTNGAAGGRLDVLGGTFERLTIPVDLEFLLGPEFFDGVPFSATVRLAGQLVATRGQVPEPSTVLLVAGGVTWLGVRRRRGRSGPSHRRAERREWLLRAGFLLLLACACKLPADVEMECANGIDDDEDGSVDCADSDCSEVGALCILGEDCTNGVDDDGDQLVDCADTTECCGDGACTSFPACSPELDCGDGLDNEGDGLIDCEDSDCAADPACHLGPSPIESLSCLDQMGTVLLDFSRFDQVMDDDGCEETASLDTDIGGLTTIEAEQHVELTDDPSRREHEVSVVCSHQRAGIYAGTVVCRGTVDAAISYLAGGDHIFVGLRRDRFGLPPTLGSSVTVDCDGRSTNVDPFDGAIAVATSPSGGVCTARIELFCNALGAGASGTCRDTLFVQEPSGGCSRDSQCDSGQRCGPFGECQVGTAGDPCANNHDCEVAQGLFCSSSEICSDGSAFSLCSPDLGDLECADGTHCDVDGYCSHELCSNGIDDDGDGLVDCDAPECLGFFGCDGG